MLYRPRRTRKNEIIREMVAETKLSKEMFLYPLFVNKHISHPEPIETMPGICRFPVDGLVKEVEQLLQLGIHKFLLFGAGDEKTDDASSSYDFKGVIPTAVRRLKADFGNDLYIVTDVCVCAYTTHAHCGILTNDHVLNDPILEVLLKIALEHAKAGADMVSPSDMMDGSVLRIRETLDRNGFENTALMSHAVKFASSYYSPFRKASDAAPEKGNRMGYQMDFRNSREAVREALTDEEEGADILMVEPALAYLDLISSVRENCLLPIACYNTSGEYSLIKAAARNGWVDEARIVIENMYAFARAGADIIITYHAKDIMKNNWL